MIKQPLKVSFYIFSIILLIPTGIAFGEQTVNNRIEIDNDDIDLAIEAGDLFGYDIEAIGDLDGDGVIDLATIKFEDDSGITLDPANDDNAGSILILFMNSDGTVSSTNEITLEDNFTNGIGNVCLNDAANQVDNRSLEQLEFVGDLDNDGMPTLALGAASHNHNGIIDSGVVYMLELDSDGTVDTCFKIVPSISSSTTGFAPANNQYLETTDAFFGWPLIATDLNGDGQNELIVGASDDTDATTNLWVLFLNSTGGVASHPATPILGITDIEITPDTIDRDYISDGDTISGGTKIVIGVENGDDTPGNTTGDEVGAIHIINLTSDGAFSSSTQILGISLGQGIGGDDDGEEFGRGVAGIGDMDGDGVDDIMVGNISGDDTETNSGEVYILYLNSDDTVKESQKISNISEKTRTGSAPFSSDDLFGNGMALWIEDGTSAVIAIGVHNDDTGDENTGAINLFYITRGNTDIEKRSSSCADCIPPTFGKNKNGVLLVSEGFIFNGNPTDVTDYHTPFPLITVITNQTNTVTVKVYENSGVSYIDLIQLGLGMPEVGSPLNDAQVLLEFWIDNTEVYKIVKVDKNNLVDVVNATTTLVGCLNDNGENCLELSVKYIYRDQPKYNIMAINAVDFKRNTWNNYMNEGIEVIGESLNDPLLQQVIASKGGVFYPQKAGEATLTLSDYKTDMWTDEYGYIWSTNEHGPYLVDIIPTPVKIPDEVSPWSGYNDRWHSEFGEYVKMQQEKAAIIFDEMNKQERNGPMNTAIIPDSQIVFDRIDRDDPNISQSLIKEAQRILVEYDKQNKLDNSHKYEKSIFAKTIKAILAQETSENHTQKTKSKLFVDVDILNNVLTVSGNIGDGDTDIPIVLKSTGSDMTLLEGFFANNDGSFSQGFLSHYYADFVLSQGDIILKEFEYSTIK